MGSPEISDLLSATAADLVSSSPKTTQTCHLGENRIGQSACQFCTISGFRDELIQCHGESSLLKIPAILPIKKACFWAGFADRYVVAHLPKPVTHICGYKIASIRA
jgi:hypothetical protein